MQACVVVMFTGIFVVGGMCGESRKLNSAVLLLGLAVALYNVFLCGPSTPSEYTLAASNYKHECELSLSLVTATLPAIM